MKAFQKSQKKKPACKAIRISVAATPTGKFTPSTKSVSKGLVQTLTKKPTVRQTYLDQYERQLGMRSPVQKNSVNVEVFTKFRRDRILVHLQQQHAKKWAEFYVSPKTRSGEHTFPVPEGVVDAIQWLFSNNAVAPNANEFIIEFKEIYEVVMGDNFIEAGDGTFVIRVSNRQQLETVIRCANAHPRFRAIARSFDTLGEALRNMKSNEKMVVQSVWNFVAMNLVAINVLLQRT
ncbi:hypothetical protein BBJ28_00020052 [Nothophytophthora sp. Chile5]|nr:hypothetical protein BBJ28_00020052 [Nothophytophthora sp. Chile5]